MNDCCPDNRQCRWGVGSNMPGYMPDSDVAHYGNHTAAVLGYLEDVKRAIDEDGEAYDGGTGSEHDELLAAFEQHKADCMRRLKARKGAFFPSFCVGQYIHWVSRV